MTEDTKDGRPFGYTTPPAGILGAALLFFARLPLYLKGRFLFWGPKELPRFAKVPYRVSYRFIGASAALFAFAIAGLFVF